MNWELHGGKGEDNTENVVKSNSNVKDSIQFDSIHKKCSERANLMTQKTEQWLPQAGMGIGVYGKWA